MLNLTLKQLGDELASGRVSSVEATQYFLNRIAGAGKSLNAFVTALVVVAVNN